MKVCTCQPSTGEADAGGSLELTAAILTSSVTTGFSGRPCLKKQNDEQLRKTPDINLWPLSANAQVCVWYLRGHICISIDTLPQLII